MVLLHLSSQRRSTLYLNGCDMNEKSPRFTPLPKNLNFDEFLKSPPIAENILENYQKTIGKNRYMAGSTRFGIVFAVSKLALFSNRPTYQHFHLLNHLLHYLKDTRTLVIHYAKHNFPAHIATYAYAGFVNSAPCHSQEVSMHVIWCSSFMLFEKAKDFIFTKMRGGASCSLTRTAINYVYRSSLQHTSAH